MSDDLSAEFEKIDFGGLEHASFITPGKMEDGDFAEVPVLDQNVAQRFKNIGTRILRFRRGEDGGPDFFEADPALVECVDGEVIEHSRIDIKPTDSEKDGFSIHVGKTLSISGIALGFVALGIRIKKKSDT